MISELTLPIHSDRLMAIRIDMPHKDPITIINVYFPTTNTPVDDYCNVLNDLQLVYATYINDGHVIMCGDFNGQLGSSAGPRGNDPQNIRGKHLMDFIEHNDASSMIVDGKCSGPVCTFWPGDDSRLPSQLDHFVISRDNSHIVDYCLMCDDHSLNTSDHLPIVLSIVTNITRHEPYQRVTYNWCRCDIDQYCQMLRNTLNSELNHISIQDNQGIDLYLDTIQGCVLTTMQQCVPTSHKCPYKKPYWDRELKDAHAEQKRKQDIWITNGRPRGMHHDTYSSYKLSKRCFAKLLKARQLQHEQARFEAAEHAYDMDSHTLWKLVQSRKGSNLHSIVHDGVRHSSPEALLQVWNSHYKSLLNEQESSSNSYNSDFGFHIQEEVDHLKNSMPHTEDTTGILRDPITVNEVAQVCGSMPNRKAPGADLISYESLKNGGHSLFVHLTNLYNAIIDQVYKPQPLKYNVIIHVHK